MTPDQWLCRLLDATTMPPITDDVTALIDAFEVMMRDRQALFDDPGRPSGLGPNHSAIVAEIELRQAAWRTVLAAAREVVAAQRSAANQLRSYQHAA